MMIAGKPLLFFFSVWIYLLMLIQGGHASKMVLANVHLCMMYVKQTEIFGLFFSRFHFRMTDIVQQFPFSFLSHSLSFCVFVN